MEFKLERFHLAHAKVTCTSVFSFGSCKNKRKKKKIAVSKIFCALNYSIE